MHHCTTCPVSDIHVLQALGHTNVDLLAGLMSGGALRVSTSLFGWGIGIHARDDVVMTRDTWGDAMQAATSMQLLQGDVKGAPRGGSELQEQFRSHLRYISPCTAMLRRRRSCRLTTHSLAFHELQ